MEQYVVYYRVSTKKQGKSGLGLDAQKEMVKNYLGSKYETQILGEYTETESASGMKNRPELEKAIAQVKKDPENRCLLVAKLDRLARNVFFIANLEKSKVNFKCVDIPEADNFTIHVLSAMAQKERELISQRTKAAMMQAKKRGKKFGTDNPKTKRGLLNYHKKMLAKPVLERPCTKRAVERALNMKPIIEPLIKAGMYKTQIADHLTVCGVKTVYGKTKWNCGHLDTIMNKWVHQPVS